MEITINKLYKDLSKLKNLDNKINKLENKIEINFNNFFKLEIIFKIYFNIYINGYFYYDVEGQDIYGFIEEIANDDYIIIEKKSKNILFRCNKFKLLTRKHFEKHKQKWLNKKGVIIYSINEIMKL